MKKKTLFAYSTIHHGVEVSRYCFVVYENEKEKKITRIFSRRVRTLARVFDLVASYLLLLL